MDSRTRGNMGRWVRAVMEKKLNHTQLLPWRPVAALQAPKLHLSSLCWTSGFLASNWDPYPWLLWGPRTYTWTMKPAPRAFQPANFSAATISWAKLPDKFSFIFLKDLFTYFKRQRDSDREREEEAGRGKEKENSVHLPLHPSNTHNGHGWARLKLGVRTSSRSLKWVVGFQAIGPSNSIRLKAVSVQLGLDVSGLEISLPEACMFYARTSPPHTHSVH